MKKKLAIYVMLGTVLISSLLLTQIYINASKKIIKNGALLSVLINGTRSSTLPTSSDGDFKAEIDCTNGVGKWEDYKFTISKIAGNVSCDISFTTITSFDYVAEKIKALASSIANTSVASGTKGELHTIENSANAHIRYTGQEPNNYVWFNNEMWRIIGVVPAALTSGATSTTSLVKIIKNESIGAIAYDAKNSAYSGAWGSNTLYTLLNSFYWGKTDGTNSNYCYGSGTLSKIKCDFDINGIEPTGYYGSMVQNVYWNTAPITSPLPALDAYNAELETKTVSGYIGLMSYSDYAYAADSEYYLTSADAYNTTEITLTNWLYNMGLIQTSTQFNSGGVWRTTLLGGLDTNTAIYGNESRPVLYLKSNVYVISGEGTQISPYILGQDHH